MVKRRGRATRRSTVSSVPCDPPLQVTVEKLVAGGDGLARLEDGRACFITGAFPGDQVAISSLEPRSSYVRARKWRLVTGSADREPAACALARSCGGCNWMGLGIEAQQAAKRAILLESLARVAGVQLDESEIGLLPSASALAYRSRIRMHIDRKGQLGFLGRSGHRLVPVEQCPVTTPALSEALATLHALHHQHPAFLGGCTQLELRATAGRPSIKLYQAPAALQRVAAVQKDAAGEKGATPTQSTAPAPAPVPAAFAEAFNVGFGSARVADSAEFDRLPLRDGLALAVLPGDFSQVNWPVNQAIIDELLAGAAERGLATFADLYCGAGNFALPMLQAGYAGYGVESNQGAIAGARQAAQELGAPTEAFVEADARVWAQRRAEAAEPVDLVIVDPPRAGITAGIEAVAALAQRSIFLCACDPVTGARDIARLIALGFVLEKVSIFDMFPQTHHFEVVAWLRREE